MGYLTTTNDKDFVFRRGGKQLTLTLTKDGQRYAANFDSGLRIAYKKTRTILRSQEREAHAPIHVKLHGKGKNSKDTAYFPRDFSGFDRFLLRGRNRFENIRSFQSFVRLLQHII